MDDLISRRATIDLIHKTIYGFFDIVEDESEEPMSEKDKLLLEVNKAVSNGIKDLPPAQSERKKGRWNTDKESPEYATCSVCGHCDWDCTESEYFKYCPNCGAEMDEGKDNE